MKTKEFDATKIQSIKLPSFLRQGKIFVNEIEDALIIKKNPVPNFRYVRQKLKALKNKVSKQEIERAIQAVRALDEGSTRH